jgi:hypothetical protein
MNPDPKYLILWSTGLNHAGQGMNYSLKKLL